MKLKDFNKLENGTKLKVKYYEDCETIKVGDNKIKIIKSNKGRDWLTNTLIMASVNKEACDIEVLK